MDLYLSDFKITVAMVCIYDLNGFSDTGSTDDALTSIHIHRHFLKWAISVPYFFMVGYLEFCHNIHLHHSTVDAIVVAGSWEPSSLVTLLVYFVYTVFS